VLWIQADVYTSFRPDTSLLKDEPTQFSLTYLLWDVRHIYNYTKLIDASSSYVLKTRSGIELSKITNEPAFSIQYLKQYLLTGQG
jgi:hypothetical protein